MPSIDHLKKWWAAHLTLVAGILAFLDPSIEHYASQHPTGTAAAILLLIVNAAKARITPPAATPADVVDAVATTTPLPPNSSISMTRPKT